MNSNKPTESFTPENTSLPFFTYGVFRPGEIPYLGIRSFVQESKPLTIKGNVRLRDGVFIFSEGRENIEGYLLYFKSDCIEEAYRYIAELEPQKIFYWNTQTEKDIEFNILYGKSPNKGSESLKELHSEYSTLKDPYLNDALEMLRDEDVPSNHFQLQMRYLFLWTIIERFIFLRYSFGSTPVHAITRLAQNPYLAISIKRTVTETSTVYRTDDLTKYTLDPDDPKKSLNYYYTIRSNLTHRGKGQFRDRKLLECAYQQLRKIVHEVISKTIDYCEEVKKGEGIK